MKTLALFEELVNVLNASDDINNILLKHNSLSLKPHFIQHNSTAIKDTLAPGKMWADGDEIVKLPVAA